MTKSVKAPAAKGWTQEVTAKAVEMYAAKTELSAIAKELGKTVPSVRSKLVAEGVYVKQESRAVGGASPVRKIALVKQLAEALELELTELESLEKASKPALELLLEKMKQIDE